MVRDGMSHSEAGRLGAMSEGTVRANQQKHDDCVRRYNANPKRCRSCGTVLDYDHRTNTFCSRSCSAAFNNKDRVVPKPSDCSIEQCGVEETIRYCVYCGNKLKSTQKQYCSEHCRYNHGWYLKKQLIDQTGQYPHNPKVNDTDRKIVRRYLEEKVGHKCAICGQEVWNNQPIPLVTDHIDGNSTNHSVDNLRLICPNCDAQTETYKTRNGHVSTRTWRKQYYKPSKTTTDE